MNMHDIRDRQIHERSLELAALAVDFELSREETAELEDHLATCSTCARRAAALRGDAIALARPLLLQPSPRVDAAVYARIARRPAGPQRLVLVAAAALLILALLSAAAIGAYLMRTWQTQPFTVVPLPTSPVALVSPSPAAPQPSPSVRTSPTIGPSTPSVSDVVPTIATLPASGNGAGLTWTLGRTDPNTYGNQIAYGPAGWMHAVTNRPGRPAPRVMLSADLRTWSDVTPLGKRLGCVALAASRSAYVSLCEGLEMLHPTDGRGRRLATRPVFDHTSKERAEAVLFGRIYLPRDDRRVSLVQRDLDVVRRCCDGRRSICRAHHGSIIDAVVGRSSGGYVIAGRAADTEAEFRTPTRPFRSGRGTRDDRRCGHRPMGRPGPPFPSARSSMGRGSQGLATDGPGGGIVAVGHSARSPMARTSAIAVWRSADAVTWQHLTGPAFDLRRGRRWGRAGDRSGRPLARRRNTPADGGG